MYESPIQQQVNREIIAARLQLAALGLQHPDVNWTAYDACESARSDTDFNPNALGLALTSMLEDNSCVRDPQTGFVTFPVE